MNSSKKKKVRKVISIHPRKLSTTTKSILSSSSLITSAGTKRRINNLLKNNKVLAVALQNARCELSTNRKLLEESSEYLNKIKFGRLKMLEMQSVLKSFVENFDEVLLMLGLEDARWLDFGSSKRLNKKFQNIEPIIETFEEYEATSATQEAKLDQEIINNCENSLNKMFHAASDVQSKNHEDIVKMVAEARCTNSTEVVDNSSQEGMKNISSSQTVFMDLAPDSLLRSNSEFREITDCVKTTEEKTNALSVKYNEESETPTLPLQTPPTHVKPTLELRLKKTKQLLLEECSLLTENHLKINTNPSAPQKSPLPLSPEKKTMEKVQNSKIPKFQDFHKAKEQKSSKGFHHKKETCKRKLDQGINEKLDYNPRKTFVIKDNEILSDFNSCAALDNNFSSIQISNEKMPNANEATNALCRRKTFVVKNSDVLEDQLIVENDRRKTFTKKSNNQSTSVQHKCNITTVTELASIDREKIEETLENFNSISHAPFCEKVVSDIHLKSAEINLSSPIINKSTLAEMGKEKQDFNNMRISTEVNTVSKTHTLQEINGNSISVNTNSKHNEAKENCDNINTKLDLDIENKQSDIEDGANFFMEIIDANISSGDIIKAVESDTKMLNIKSSKRPYEFSSDSSESECDIIESGDFDSFKQGSTIKTTPIRRHISDNKKKKVFLFDGKKRKSVLKAKKTNESICSKYGKSNEIRQADINNVSTEKEHIIKNKTVSFALDEEINKCNPGNNSQFRLCNSKSTLKISEKETKNNEKIKTNYQSCAGAVKDCIPSVRDALNFVDNQYLNDMPGASNVHKNPLIDTANENITEVKQSTQKSIKSNTLGINFSEFTENMSDIASNRMQCHMVKSTGQNPSTDIVVDDIISIAKKSKKNSSKKKETIVSKNIETDIDDLNEYKSPNVESKKSVKKSKKRDKTAPTCKKTGKNTYLVQAEIHPPPPPSPNRFKIENVNKENGVLKFKNLELSVVLNDVLKSKNIDMLNICKKDLLLPSQTTPTKPTDDIPSILEKSNLNFKENVPCTISTSKAVSTRRRRDVKSYKEPSLSLKMRR